jgi:hypothetical protein
VLLDAQAEGMTWAEIGNVYGVSRQAAHRRFSDETVVPADYFDATMSATSTTTAITDTHPAITATYLPMCAITVDPEGRKGAS